MDGKSVLGYLKELCEKIDAGVPLRRFVLRKVAGPIMVAGVALATTGCPVEPDSAPLYAAPPPSLHDDDLSSVDDNGVDGYGVPEYAAPMDLIGEPDPIKDDIDQDEPPRPRYGVPFPSQPATSRYMAPFR